MSTILCSVLPNQCVWWCLLKIASLILLRLYIFKCRNKTFFINLFKGKILDYVDSFKYLGHWINSKFTDDEDIRREIRSLAVRGNILLRKFGFCSVDIKCYLFKTFCYSLYCAALWADFYKATLYRLKVCYNNIMRRLVGVPPWESARSMFVTLGIRSFDENLRYCAISCKKLVEDCINKLVCRLNSSDAALMSKIRNNWIGMLYM